MTSEDINNLDMLEIQGLKCLFRKDTTDLNCLKEVLIQKCYQSKKHDFFIERGERWLDLGGNIGAFGLFAMANGAHITSFEPKIDNCELMELNYLNNCFEPMIHYNIQNFAITNQKVAQLTFWTGSSKLDRYRTSIFSNKKGRILSLPNKFAGDVFSDVKFDCIKMDIEGSELGIIDDGLIPDCHKLVLEYHITKDKSMENFHNRMRILCSHFSEVKYMPSLDKFNINSYYPGFFDRIIMCKK